MDLSEKTSHVKGTNIYDYVQFVASQKKKWISCIECGLIMGLLGLGGDMNSTEFRSSRESLLLTDSC